MEPYQQAVPAVLAALQVNPAQGLPAAEAQARLSRFGPNELQEKKQISPWVLFFDQFRSFIVYILLGAIVLSIAIEVLNRIQRGTPVNYTEAAVIAAILVMNAGIGFLQEYRAERAIEALKRMTSLRARVLRDGREESLDTKLLVPGDIILLEEGSKVPADARIIEAASFQAAEAALTGESVPVSKFIEPLYDPVPLGDRKNMVYCGTAITRGRAKAVVIATGMQTELGKIAGMIRDVEEEQTPLQKKLDDFGRWLGVVTLIICAAVLAILIFYNYRDTGRLNILEEIKVAVSLAVAAIPEGLPAIVTLSLALGVRKMVRRHILIRRLPSVETLGECTVICSDKTGTLTKNEMTVRRLWADGFMYEVTGEGYFASGAIFLDHKPASSPTLQRLLAIGALCNNAHLEESAGEPAVLGDPTEAALLVSAKKAGLDLAGLAAQNPRLDEVPFDSSRKMMSTIHQTPAGRTVYVKGAADALLHQCTQADWQGHIVPLTDSLRHQILTANDELAKQALRVLGFAYKPDDGPEPETALVFVGLQAMIDPPRPEVKSAIETCGRARIRVIMITGDHRLTAEAIAKEIGIAGPGVDGKYLDSIDDAAFAKLVATTNIYARVNPEHKMRIVKALKAQGAVAAMTGDGVNDAPAVKQADMGVAMGITGTDVTKEASDMILTDDNFASIVSAVEEGRGIYDNITKFINYLLSCNLGEILVIFLATTLSALFFPVVSLPLTAIMLLWLNLVTDGLPALALGADPAAKSIMDRPPRNARESIMNGAMLFNVFSTGLLIVIGVLWLFHWAQVHGPARGYAGDELVQYAQTVAFTALIVMEIARLQAIRSEYRLGPFANRWLILAVLSSIGLQLLVLYTPLARFFKTVPLQLEDWLYILGAALAAFALSWLIRIARNLITGANAQPMRAA